MGYRIEYSGGQATFSTVKHRHNGWRWGILILAACIMLVSGTVREALCGALIPGDDEVTLRALGGLVDSLKDGTPVGAALEVFCQEIIYGTP